MKKLFIITLLLSISLTGCSKEEDYKNKVKPPINFLEKPIDINN